MLLSKEVFVRWRRILGDVSSGIAVITLIHQMPPQFSLTDNSYSVPFVNAVELEHLAGGPGDTRGAVSSCWYSWPVLLGSQEPGWFPGVLASVSLTRQRRDSG